MKIELQAIFSGNVQGVFFRAHVKKYASEMGLSGFAKNLPDGSVEVRAVGQKIDLENFIAKIKDRPGFGRIDQIQIFYSKKYHKYNGFRAL